ncbi:hypothetical protein [Saccharothrix australiensis]|uniref:Uncharacterized protein n=1 Tax=Saccharothrix australiensis TaxID=2072 RepID=A0A495W0G2_9PSEU|nr:hypothetical protein [Saccharothrix australiensis]RKT55172.1 hypothetical protein C8E97_3830 [Saccharothrix australiensis]
MTDPTRAWLADVATPQLYRRNAFRITGLPTDADRRVVRQRRQKVNTMLELGVAVDLGHDLPVEPSDVARAFELILGDPRRRLVDELFWLWGDEGGTCRCTRALHRDHDAAVRAHSAALDVEVGGAPGDAELDRLEGLWAEAGRRWGQVLRRSGFWDHVRDRVAALDDKQLDESVVDLLRDEVPVVLVKPLIQLAATPGSDQGWLADRARDWPAPRGVVDDLLEQAAEPAYESVRERLRNAAEQLRDGDPAVVAALLQNEVRDELDRLEEFVPHERHRRTASARDDAAVVLNNCATKLVDTSGSTSAELARRWLESAADLATDSRTVAQIEQNDTAITELAAAMAMIRQQVRDLVALGRKDVARRMLRAVRSRAGDGAGSAELERMLRDLGVRGPVPARVREHHGGEGLRRFFRFLWRTAATLLLVGLIVYAFDRLFAGDADPVPVRVFSESPSGNAPPGTCVRTRAGWDGDKARVPSVPCGEEHWGEILAFVPLGDTPSPYPGDEVVQQRARYGCAWHQALNDLSTAVYATRYVHSDQASWNDGGKTYENYATCVLHRVDDKPLPTRQLVDPRRAQPADFGLVLDMFNADVSANPPVGSCVQTKQSLDEDAHKVTFGACDRPHWGEVIAYPVLYRPGEAWPGDEAVYAAAGAACRKAAVDRGLGAAYQYHVTWPGSGWWTDTPDKPKYAACTVSSADGNPLHTSLK